MRVCAHTMANSGGGGSYMQSSAEDEEMVAGAAAHLAPLKKKKKRNLAGHPDPEAEVIALSPRSLLATNRFICEVCNKGFQRDQNLQLHRRGHNLPWRLKSLASSDNNVQVKKKVYVCPELGCVHHDPARALGDLTGIKKHFCRKHGEKKWKCERCSKQYAVHSDWKAHQKVCGTREYRCFCGTAFSRRDSFINHRAFCDALAVEDTTYQGSSTKHGEIMQDISNLNGSLIDKTKKSSSGIIGSAFQESGNNVNIANDVDAPDNEYHSGGEYPVSTTMDSTSSPISQLTGEALTPQDAINLEPTVNVNISHMPEDGTTSVDGRLQSIQDKLIPEVRKDPMLCLSLSSFLVPGNEEAHDMEYKSSRMHGLHNGEQYTRDNISASNNNLHVDSAPSASGHAMDMLASLFSPSKGNSTKGNNHKNGESQYMKASELMLGRSHEKPGTSISSTPNEFRSTKGSYHSGTPMSATALLQKAAQMGAKASNLSFFQKFGGALNAVDQSSFITTSSEVQESKLAGLSTSTSTFQSQYQPYVLKDMSKDTETPNMDRRVSCIKTGMPFSLELSSTSNHTHSTGSCNTFVNQHQGSRLNMISSSSIKDQTLNVSSGHGRRHAASSMETWVVPQSSVSTGAQVVSAHVVHEGNHSRELLDFLGVADSSSRSRGIMNHQHDDIPFHSHMKDLSNPPPPPPPRGNCNGVLYHHG